MTDLRSDPLWRLARTLQQFSDMDAKDPITAKATADGGTIRLTYGDLTMLAKRLGVFGERLDRITSWHSRESGPGGLVGDYCRECGTIWPCDTRRMADGTYVNEEAP